MQLVLTLTSLAGILLDGTSVNIGLAWKAVGVFVVSPRMGSNLVHVRSGNLSVVLNAIRRIGSVSRAELTVHTHLTPSTITNLVNELLRWNLLAEAGSVPSSGGRNRTLLSINADAYQVIAIAVQPSEIQGALVNLAGQVSWRCTKSIPTNATDEVCAEACDVLYQELIGMAQTHALDMVGVGVAHHRGCISQEKPWWQTLPNLSSANGIFQVDYAVRAAALGEAWFGAGKEVDSLVFLDWSSNHDVGVVLGGEVFTGAHGNVSLQLPDCCFSGIEAAIHAIISVYDPDIVVLHNNVSEMSHDLTLSDRAQSSRVMPASDYLSTPKVCPAVLGADATLIGAACLVLGRFFADPVGHLSRLPISPQWNLPVSY